MTTSSLFRLSALAGLASGVCIITGRVLAGMPNTQPGEVFDVLSPFFALFLSIGLYLGQRRSSGVFGLLSFVLLFGGLVFLVCLDFYGAFIRIDLPAAVVAQIENGPSAPVFAAGLLAFLAGEILFGVSVIRAGMYSRVAAILFMLGLLAVVLHPTKMLPERAVDVGAIMAGIGLIWWSIDLTRRAARQTAAE